MATIYKPNMSFLRLSKQQKVVDAIIATDKFLVQDFGDRFGFCLKDSHTFYWISFGVTGAVFSQEIFSQATGRCRRDGKAKRQVTNFILKHTGINIILI